MDVSCWNVSSGFSTEVMLESRSVDSDEVVELFVSSIMRNESLDWKWVISLQREKLVDG